MHDTGHGTPSGGFTTTHLRCVRYGPGCIAQLPEVIKDIKPNDAKDVKVLIITGKSLSQTPVLPKIEEILKKEGVYAGTFTKIRQHTPIEDVEEALQVIRKHSVTLLIGAGGGSPIDACKTLSYFHNERHGNFIPHIAIPTTLSAAEWTQLAGHTDKDGKKAMVTAEEICPKGVILDAEFTMYTPQHLWLTTGLRALDHAFESLYRPGAQYPLQQMALAAVREIFTFLPQCKDAGGRDMEARQKLLIAAWMSLFPTRLDTALGPSHALGHGLGAKYSIPHGVCSVLTLPRTVRLMAKTLPEGISRGMLANTFSYLPTSDQFPHRDHYTETNSDEPEINAGIAAAIAIEKLIDIMDVQARLSQYNVPKEDLPGIAKAAYEATASKPGWKDVCPSEEALLLEVLEKVY